MNSDDRTRAAFDELKERTESVDPQYSLQRMPREPERRLPRFVPALVGAVTVVAVIGGVAGLLGGPNEVAETTTTIAVTTTGDTATTIPVTTTAGIETTTTFPVGAVDSAPTHRVVDVADDDVLFVRRDPAPGGEPYAELPPDYAGIVSLGVFETADDGGTWMQVQLVDPIRLIGLGEPLHGAPITGWVNASYVAEYDPSFADAVAPCQGSGTTSVTGSADTDSPDHIYSMRQYGLGGCIRTIVRFGADWDTEWGLFYDRITTDVRPAGVPTFSVDDVNGVATVVVPDVPYASVTGDVGAKVGRWSSGSLAIFTMVPGFTNVAIHDGHLIIDTTPSGASAPFDDNIHLLGEPVVGDGGTLEVWGLARPFEATMGTRLSDPDAEAPEFVMTTDYIDAWGMFRYRAIGVEPGPGTVTFLQEGEDVVETSFGFEMPDREESRTVTFDDVELTDIVRAYAQGTGDGTPRVGGSTMWLGVEHSAPVSDDWIIDVEEWNGYAGPFDVLGPLRGEFGPTITIVGTHNHCAGPPLELPADFEGLRQVSIQPAGITSCLEWYAVDLFVDDSGEIRHVMLDLWEP